MTVTKLVANTIYIAGSARRHAYRQTGLLSHQLYYTRFMCMVLSAAVSDHARIAYEHEPEVAILSLPFMSASWLLV